MRVVDLDTGEDYILDRTPELSADLEGFRSTECNHDNTEIRQRKFGGGSLHFIRQCVTCGKHIGMALKKTRELENAPAWDNEIPDTYREAREVQRLAIYQKHVRKQRDRLDGFQREYDIYLTSPEWRRKRAAIFKRANGVCEGCLEQKAVQVHHMTYTHFKNEFMFELVAVCEACHMRLHPEKHAMEDEWRDDFPCDGCRWQDQQGNRKWCGTLDVYATDALAEGGECGPTRKAFEPLR